VVATFATGILALAWIAIHETAGLFMFAGIYGFASGGFVSLPPPTIVSLSPNLSVLGTRMGMCFAVSSLGLLIGTPISGQILSKAHSWAGLQAFSGATIFLTAVIILCTRVVKAGLKVNVKA
jgi:MFS family permease